MYQSLDQLHQAMKNCRGCILAETRNHVIVGEGPGTAPVFLMGEAPGGHEDVISGRAFTGEAGNKLNEFLQVLGLTKEQIFLANTVKCRPTKPAKRSRYNEYANRRPTVMEIKACSQWIANEIALIKPQVIVTLGSVPLYGLLGKNVKMADYHGQPFHLERSACFVFPLYHPASLIYDRSKKVLYMEDLAQLQEFLNSLGLFT